MHFILCVFCLMVSTSSCKLECGWVAFSGRTPSWAPRTRRAGCWTIRAKETFGTPKKSAVQEVCHNTPKPLPQTFLRQKIITGSFRFPAVDLLARQIGLIGGGRGAGGDPLKNGFLDIVNLESGAGSCTHG